MRLSLRKSPLPKFTLKTMLALVTLAAIFLAAFTSASEFWSRVCGTIVLLAFAFNALSIYPRTGARRAFSIGFVLSTSIFLGLYHFGLVSDSWPDPSSDTSKVISPDGVIESVYARVSKRRIYGGAGNLPIEDHPMYKRWQAQSPQRAIPNIAREFTLPEMPYFTHIGRALLALLCGVAGGLCSSAMFVPRSLSAAADDA